MVDQYATSGDVAAVLSQRHGVYVAAWRILRLYEDGVLPEPARFGGRRLIPRTIIPQIEAALVARGWLPAAPDANIPSNTSAARGRLAPKDAATHAVEAQ